jgi:hypothetical protein
MGQRIEASLKLLIYRHLQNMVGYKMAEQIPYKEGTKKRQIAKMLLAGEKDDMICRKLGVKKKTLYNVKSDLRKLGYIQTPQRFPKELRGESLREAPQVVRVEQPKPVIRVLSLDEFLGKPVFLPSPFREQEEKRDEIDEVLKELVKYKIRRMKMLELDKLILEAKRDLRELRGE